ncbi:MAG TPA: hypothetical protein VHF06_11480 [Pseudonocardiaceae bacterium]|nr:hypothetical protein [Pseudonocardiaceae bacterium]
MGASFAKGRRSARIPPHNKMAARRVDGLETAAVDRSPMVIRPLEPEDDRAMTVNVAGPTALLVAKAYKINDRLEKASSKPGRVVDKDAGDVVRIMMTHQPKAIATAFAELTADPRVGSVTATGLKLLRAEFGGPDTPGVRMAVQALAGAMPEARIRALAPAFIAALP